MNLAARKAVQAATKANMWLYRCTNGRIGGRGMNGRPLLLLTVPGRRSGALHTVPVVYFDHSGGYLVCRDGHGWFQDNTAVVSESPGCRSGPNPYPAAGSTRLMHMSRLTLSERSCGADRDRGT
jgi:hypothetical protein